MANNRKIAFRNGEIYHVFNRGIDRRSIFTGKREFERAKQLIKFYRHKEIPIRYSQILLQPEELRSKILEGVFKSDRLIDVLSYSLMPNHFHLLVKQLEDNGISKFVSNFTNSYTKYFNTKSKRAGPIFEGVFKAVHVETDEQLIHLTRYIHLNPVASSIIPENRLNNYLWSSYLEYLSLSNDGIAEKRMVLDLFKSAASYREFVEDQIDYAKELDSIKHLVME